MTVEELKALQSGEAPLKDRMEYIFKRFRESACIGFGYDILSLRYDERAELEKIEGLEFEVHEDDEHQTVVTWSDEQYTPYDKHQQALEQKAES